jgi:hypothetical protein
MKGYVTVSRADIRSACDLWKERNKSGAKLRDKGIALYYEEFYVKGSWLTRWWNKDKTPIEFARGRLQMFGQWSDILYKVLTEDEIEILDDWQWDHGRERYEQCLALLNASSGQSEIKLGETLCAWVNKNKWLP